MDSIEITALVSSIFGILCITFDLFVLILVYRTKPRLHTVNHLLICNTSIASMMFSIVYIINYVHTLFIYWDKSNLTCRFRSYFAYVSSGELIHSYMIQSISRFFFSIFATKYRWLTTFRTHYVLIAVQWLTVLIITSPVVVLDTTRYYPKALCWLTPAYANLGIYLEIINLFGPFLVVVCFYGFILNRVRKSTRNLVTEGNSIHNQKRDVAVLRNVVIIFSIGMIGALPDIILALYPGDVLYCFDLVCSQFSVTLSALFNILLDREIRKTIRSYFQHQRTQVTPVVEIRGTENEIKTFSKQRKNHE